MIITTYNIPITCLRPVNGNVIYWPSTGYWYILRSSNQAVTIQLWGTAEDIPVIGDYDGDFRDDIAVYRPSTGVWYALQSSNSSMYAVQFGIPDDIPVPSVDTP